MNTYNAIVFGDVWDEQYRRRQQFAVELAKQEYISHVTYIEQPLTVVSLVKYIFGKSDDDAKRRWKLVINNGFICTRGDVRVFTPLTIMPLIRLSLLWDVTAGLFLLCIYLNLYFARIKGKNEKAITVITMPNWTDKWFEMIKNEISIYDCSEAYDRLMLNTGLKFRYKEKIRHWDESATKKADIVLVNSEKLQEEKRKHNNNAYLFPNAISSDIIKTFENMVQNDIYKYNSTGPVLGYVGHLNELVDIALIKKILETHKDWKMVIVGTVSSEKLISHYDNLILLGRQPYEKLPYYVAGFDVCLGLYKVDELNETNIGLKFPLYIASGKPVVSTDAGGASFFKDHIRIVGENEDYLSVLEYTIKNLKPKNEFKYKDGYKLTWEYRIQQLEEIINTSLSRKALNERG